MLSCGPISDYSKRPSTYPTSRTSPTVHKSQRIFIYSHCMSLLSCLAEYNPHESQPTTPQFGPRRGGPSSIQGPPRVLKLRQDPFTWHRIRCTGPPAPVSHPRAKRAPRRAAEDPSVRTEAPADDPETCASRRRKVWAEPVGSGRMGARTPNPALCS